MPLHSFKYSEKHSYWVFSPAIVFACLAAYCYFFQASVSFKRFELLHFPISYYVFGGLALIGAIYGIYTTNRAKESKKNLVPIELSNDDFSFPKGASNTVTINYSDVYELWVKTESDDGESIILMALDNKKKDERFEFFADNFASLEEFLIFKSFMEKKCTKITNRG